MASNKIVKGNKVQLSKFLKWDVHDIFGHKIIEEGSSKFVNFVWCKLCAKNKAAQPTATFSTTSKS